MITLSEAVRLFRLSDDDYICLFQKGTDLDRDYIWMKVRAVRRRFYMRKTLVHSIRETSGTGDNGAERHVAALEISGRFRPRRKNRGGTLPGVSARSHRDRCGDTRIFTLRGM